MKQATIGLFVLILSTVSAWAVQYQFVPSPMPTISTVISTVNRSNDDGTMTSIPFNVGANADAQRFWRDWQSGVMVLSTTGVTLSYGTPPS